jgi:PIN domain nuclease of toxin-antitoxin system
VADRANDVFLSAASIWESALKSLTGKLTLDRALDTAAAAAGFAELAVTWAHAVRATSLPPLHKDPFDRMLVAQALEEGLVLVTRDPLVRQYQVATLPA